MEGKTIGGFIAALRKANGMTQRDLADRLNVSDKTISRWERNEGAPDLSLIPVIAEIFGVTCDELLRGERKSPEERSSTQENKGSTPKGEKERQRLLKSALSQYQTQTYLSMGISAAGLMVALICNLAFLKALLGFLCGAIFFIASVVCQGISLNRGLLRVEDGELDGAALSLFRRRIIRLTQQSVGVTVGLVGFTAPLLLADPYMGLTAESMLRLGIMGAAGFLLLYALVCYFLNAWFVKKGIYILGGKEGEVYHHNHQLKGTCGIVLVLLLLLTLGVQSSIALSDPVGTRLEGTTFQDYQSFIAFMETKVDDPRQDSQGSDSQIFYEDMPSEVWDGEGWYDEYGNQITEEEARHRTLKDQNGTVVCQYTQWNDSVMSVRYTPKDGTVLPITVLTYGDLQLAQSQVKDYNGIFVLAYCVEVVTVLVVYGKKRAKA